ITLVAGAELGACREVNGVTICPDDPLYEQIAPPPFDGKEQIVSRLAQTVETGPLDCDSNLDVLPCYTTSTGEESCPTHNETLIDTCGGLSEDPVCSFVDQGCADGAEVDGVCHLEEARFVCDEEIVFETFQQQTSLDCPDSEIRCNGNDCIEVDQEINNGITQGLAALTASQLLAFDSTCGDLDPGSCSAYPGQVRACQRGIGGIFDSCALPDAVGPGPYLDLVFSIGALVSNLTILEPSSPFRGAWEKLRDPATSALETLETPFTSISNTVLASTAPNANDTVAEEDLQRVRQELLNETADDLLSEHGDGAVNATFVQAGGGEPAANDAARNGDVVLRRSPGDRTALSLVADAYAASAADRHDPDPPPLVEADDISTAAHDDARNCIFVGTQCTADSFGACISRDHVLCCFSSPYARLAQEAAAVQFGRDVGTVDAPNCRGLTSA
ncbi:MAG: conjugal transfer protein TraN, partial [Geminicoccaceae bacterium]